jgi:hypothetical protein
MFAFVEVYRQGAWVLGDPKVVDPDASSAKLMPTNIAPPWGWEQINFYYELSGERGLPDDLSEGLRMYLAEAWGESAYGISWLTLHEIKWHLANETSQAFFHFNPDWFEGYPFADDDIRVVFWHD